MHCVAKRQSCLEGQKKIKENSKQKIALQEQKKN
jgi:hypothetical protein